MAPSQITSDGLYRAIERRLLGDPMQQGQRLLGVEYERLILARSDRKAAPLPFCRDLLRRLADALGGRPVVESGVQKGVAADGVELSMEPGGQLEVAMPPKGDLAAIDETMARVTAVIEAELENTDYELACLGHTPVSTVDELGLLPRARYLIMDEVMPRRGRLTRNMMRATAGFQLTYDFPDDADAGRKLALIYRLSPVLLALTANSREIEGRDSGFASYRHEVWWHTDWQRSGVPQGTLDAATAVRGYIDYACRAHVLFFVRDGEIVRAPDESLETLVARGEIEDADLDAHLSTLFPFVRLRNYIEVRCFDSVPWEHARSVLALLSGIVYCEKATAAAEDLSVCLVPADAEQLRRLHHDAARRALDATSIDGHRMFRELARELVGFSAATLGRATCDWAKAEDLDYVRRIIGE